MKIDVLTLFPEMFDALNCSLMGRAKEKGCTSFIATIYEITLRTSTRSATTRRLAAAREWL